MLSQERRMERYRIISVWKILQGISPNCGVELAPANERLGRRCAVPRLLPGGRAAIQTLREHSKVATRGINFGILIKIPQNVELDLP